MNSTKRLMKRLLFILDFRLDKYLLDVMFVSFGLMQLTHYFLKPEPVLVPDLI